MCCNSTRLEWDLEHIPWSSRHRRASLTKLKHYTIKQFQIFEKFKHYVKEEEVRFEYSIDSRYRSNDKGLLFSASHSPLSTYFGRTTIVLKFPFKSCAFINGLHMNNGRTAPCGVGRVIIDEPELFCKLIELPKEVCEFVMLGRGGALLLFFRSEFRPKFRLEEK